MSGFMKICWKLFA